MCVLSRGGAVKDCVLLREAVLLDDLSLAHSQVHVLMCCLSVCVCPLFYLFLISAVFYKSIYLCMYFSVTHTNMTLQYQELQHLFQLYICLVLTWHVFLAWSSLLVAKHGDKPCENFSALIGCC